MATIYRAILSLQDYSAFRAHVPELPPTHEEWQFRHDAANLKITGGGHQALGVQIDPDKFITWVRKDKGDRTEGGLDFFAWLTHRRLSERE